MLQSPALPTELSEDVLLLATVAFATGAIRRWQCDLLLATVAFAT